MEELTAALATSFNVTNAPNSTAAQHPRYSQYKQKGYETNQEKRRRQMLGKQKDWYTEGQKAAVQIQQLACVSGNRYDFMRHVRRLAENIWDDMSEDEGDDDGGRYTSPRGRGGRGRGGRGRGGGRGGGGRSPDAKGEDAMDVDRVYRKPGKYYRDQLMLSEWLVQVPDDFATDWVMVPCPVGKRNLVVASNGITRSYSKAGWKLNEFKSNLPGGNKQVERWNRDTTLLDTIYNEVTKTYYVLDMMCWKEMPLYESETEFRFYWMHDRFGELKNSVSVITKMNQFRFEPLPNFSCDRENITKVMEADMKLKLDGLLFYHKRTHYLFGSTPLVLWLKAYMLPEILQIPVPLPLMAEKPASYTTFEAHTEKVKQDKEKEEQKARERQERRRSGGRGGRQQPMEVLDTVDETKTGNSAGNNKNGGNNSADKDTATASSQEASQEMESQNDAS